MVSLARSSIIVDWRRYVTVVSMLSLTGLLLMVQAGSFMGTMQQYSFDIEGSTADLWVMGTRDTGRRGISYAMPVKKSDENMLWLHPNVADVQIQFSGSRLRWESHDGVRGFARLVPLGIEKGSLNFPHNFGEKERKALKIPGSVVVPKNYMDRLGTAPDLSLKIGNGELRNVFISGVSAPVLRMDTPNIYVSQKTYDYIKGDNASWGGASALLIKLVDPEKAEQTARELQQFLMMKGKLLNIWTRESYQKQLEDNFLKSDRVAKRLLYTVGFVAVFSLVLSSQIMRANIFAQLREFGTLHALGLSRVKLALITLEQGFWAGIVSTICCTALFFLVKFIAAQYNQDIAVSMLLLGACYTLIMGVAMVSGFFSVFVLRKIELTSLLR